MRFSKLGNLGAFCTYVGWLDRNTQRNWSRLGGRYPAREPHLMCGDHSQIPKFIRNPYFTGVSLWDSIWECLGRDSQTPNERWPVLPQRGARLARQHVWHTASALAPHARIRWLPNRWRAGAAPVTTRIPINSGHHNVKSGYHRHRYRQRHARVEPFGSPVTAHPCGVTRSCVASLQDAD